MSATWFDHAIATVAPRMAARRVMARQAFESLTRGYDGAAKGRRTDGWRAPGSSADTEIGVAGALLRDRMRDLVRNNPHAAKAVAVLVNNIIGAGIMPRAASGDDTLDRKVDALFTRWTAECDADRPNIQIWPKVRRKLESSVLSFFCEGLAEAFARRCLSRTFKRFLVRKAGSRSVTRPDHPPDRCALS